MIIDRKALFDKVREIKGKALTQPEVDAINAILDPAQAKPSAIVTPADNGKFPGPIIAGAMQAEATYGVPASVSLAQWALESGYGKSMPAGSQNPFGMKARKNETGPVVVARTREVNSKGAEYWIDAPFRKFADMGEAFEEHAKLVGTAKVYAPARAKLPDVDAFIDVLGPIYATAPNYAAVIKSIIRANNLKQYDRRSA